MPPKLIASICQVWLPLECIPHAHMCSVSLQTTWQDPVILSLTGTEPQILVKDFCSLSCVRTQILQMNSNQPSFGQWLGSLQRGSREDDVEQYRTVTGTTWDRNCGAVNLIWVQVIWAYMYLAGPLERQIGNGSEQNSLFRNTDVKEYGCTYN